LEQTAIDSERRLLMKVSEGNEQAFRELFNYWQPLFSNYILSITKSKELTAEIVQDVFLKIWLKREKLSQVEHFKAYLFKISRNEAINALRKAMREQQLVNEWNKSHHDTEDVQPESNPLHEQLELADEAIAKLTERQRQVYKLHRHEHLTYQQIADKLGIGKESVKTHLELAVKAIRKYLQDRTTVLLLLIEMFSKKL